MKEFNPYNKKFSPYLEKLYNSEKALIIYKVKDGYNLYTDFSKKIILTKKNINNFFNIFKNKKFKRETDLFIGFFGYEILCNLLGIKIQNQKKLNFYKGIFYKPETLIKIRKEIKIVSSTKKYNFNNYFDKTQILSQFKMNINYKKYKKIFDLFSKKIRQGETYQIKICTKYKNKSKINAVNFFWKLMKINSSPESFMIRDKNFSIVSCSPETLIEKIGSKIITKPLRYSTDTQIFSLEFKVIFSFSITLGPIIAKSLCMFACTSKFGIVLSFKIVSGFSIKTYFVFACFIPRLFPAPYPRFSSGKIHFKF